MVHRPSNIRARWGSYLWLLMPLSYLPVFPVTCKEWNVHNYSSSKEGRFQIEALEKNPVQKLEDSECLGTSTKRMKIILRNMGVLNFRGKKDIKINFQIRSLHIVVYLLTKITLTVRSVGCGLPLVGSYVSLLLTKQLNTEQCALFAAVFQIIKWA